MAAILLLTQRFATLGALLFFPIILNITVLTLSTIGSYTPVIATLMFLGIVFLLLWDYFKWINIFQPDQKFYLPFKPSDNRGYSSIWVVAGVVILNLGILFSMIIENHDQLPNNAAAKILSFIILITSLVPVITFSVDEYRYRKEKRITH